MFLKFFIAITIAPFVAAQIGERCAMSRDPANPNFIEHPQSCSKYLSCGSGVYMEMECPARLHFNSIKKICDWPADAGCSKRTNGHQTIPPVVDPVDETAAATPGGKCSPSPHRNQPVVAPHSDCGKFLICTGTWTLMNCPTGLLFSAETSHCEFPEHAKCCPTCTTTLRRCPIDGSILSNPTDCHKFYICNNGTLVDLVCSDRMIFSTRHGQCVTGSSCDELLLPPVDDNLPNCPVDGVLFPNYDHCDKFFICNGGTLVAQSCPPNKFFSIRHNNCQVKSKAVCASDVKSGSTN